MSLEHKPVSALSRRTLVKAAAGAAAGGIGVFGPSALPLIRRGSAAAQSDKLSFWQFYAPGGTVATQAQWFEDCVNGWNAQNDRQVELIYVPNGDYMDGTKLPTAFASGQGPDLFIISPGDFLRYYNGGVLQDLDAVPRSGRAGRFLPRRPGDPRRRRQGLRPPHGGRADGDVLQQGRLG